MSVALIVETAATSRQAIRKLLSESGLRPQAIHEATNYAEAATKLEKETPALVFSDFSLVSGKAVELGTLQKKLYPHSQAVSLFFLLTDTGAPAPYIPDQEFLIDAVIPKPFNYTNLREAFRASVTERLDVSSPKRHLEKAWELLRAGRPNDAKPLLAVARKSLPQGSPWASSLLYLEGLMIKSIGDLPSALKCFEAGLAAQSSHAGCLSARLDVLLERNDSLKAFAAGSALLKAYPSTKRRIIDLVKLALLTNNHEQIPSYCDRLGQALTDEDKSTAAHLSAGLVICGKRLVQEIRNDEGLKAFRKAEQLCDGKPQILVEIVRFLYQKKFVSEAESMLNRLPQAVRVSNEIRMIELEHINSYEIPAKVLQFALTLLADGVKTKRLYELAVEKSVAMGRPDAVTQDIVRKAVEAYPEDKERFQALFDHLRSARSAA